MIPAERIATVKMWSDNGVNDFLEDHPIQLGVQLVHPMELCKGPLLPPAHCAGVVSQEDSSILHHDEMGKSKLNQELRMEK